MHVVLRSSRARGPWSLRRKSNEAAVAEEIEKAARRFEIKIYETATVGSHVHLLVRARRREALQNFLRVIGGRIAQRVTGARKGHPCPGGFWDEIVYSRVLTGGSDFHNVARYIRQNLFETKGLISYSERPGRRAKGRREGGVGQGQPRLQL